MDILHNVVLDSTLDTAWPISALSTFLTQSNSEIMLGIFEIPMFGYCKYYFLGVEPCPSARRIIFGPDEGRQKERNNLEGRILLEISSVTYL
mmetsp:Transcript_8244/g.12636  ORF Transcript_8244/g.12636 Transcript_8244/m.12636 type:complete len:92 (-) Transcript_8244:60-335(-)